MNTIEMVFAPLIPVAIVIAMGYMAGKMRQLKPEDSLLVTRLVLTWIFPSMLFVGMATTPRDDLLNGHFIICALLGLMLMYGAAFLWGYLKLRCLRAATLKAFVCAFPDAAFMGIPILALLFGPSSVYSVLIINLVSSLVMIPLTAMLLNIGQPGQNNGLFIFAKTVCLSLKKPLVWAPALGIVLSLTDIVLPRPIQQGFTLIGSATSGVSLFCLGLIISSVKIRLSADIWGNVILKNSLHPILMYVLTLMLGVSGLLQREIILLAALPSATMTAMFANEARIYEGEASTSILLGTVLSLFTFALAIYLTA